MGPNLNFSEGIAEGAVKSFQSKMTHPSRTITNVIRERKATTEGSNAGMAGGRTVRERIRRLIFFVGKRIMKASRATHTERGGKRHLLVSSSLFLALIIGRYWVHYTRSKAAVQIHTTVGLHSTDDGIRKIFFILSSVSVESFLSHFGIYTRRWYLHLIHGAGYVVLGYAFFSPVSDRFACIPTAVLGENLNESTGEDQIRRPLERSDTRSTRWCHVGHQVKSLSDMPQKTGWSYTRVLPDNQPHRNLNGSFVFALQNRAKRSYLKCDQSGANSNHDYI
ncbi:hypothetical protein ACFE04_019891 [Oxalis oulophora]